MENRLAIFKDKWGKLERYLGFEIRTRRTAIDSDACHDESISYSLCQRFYGRKDELEKALAYANNMLDMIDGILEPEGLPEYARKDYENYKSTNTILLIYQLVGNMYYMQGDFQRSAEHIMRCLSYERNDIGLWVELLFSLRSAGEFVLFEDAMFNFRALVIQWQADPDKILTHQKVVELIDAVSGND
ncbi:hypothetical protein JXB31_00345 [Candidatus Woesearchaeota archaeon]|nr:hypothetical protein [Candidatus Woesearchaeota archaeon]